MELTSRQNDAKDSLLRFDLDAGADIDMRLMNYLNSLDDFIAFYNDVISIVAHQNMSVQEKSSALSDKLAGEIEEKKNGMYKYIVSAAKKRKFIHENTRALPVDSKIKLIDEKCRKFAEQYIIDGFSDLSSERESSSPLHIAAELGSLEIITSILDCFKHYRHRIVNIRDSKGQTVMFAVLLNLQFRKDSEVTPDDERRIRIMKFLIQNGGLMSHLDNQDRNVFQCLKNQTLGAQRKPPPTHSGPKTVQTQDIDIKDKNVKVEKEGALQLPNANFDAGTPNVRSLEIKMLLKEILKLVVLEGKSAIRKCTSKIASIQYENFQACLVNGRRKQQGSDSTRKGLLWKDFIYDENTEVRSFDSDIFANFYINQRVIISSNRREKEIPSNVLNHDGKVGTIVSLGSRNFATIKFDNEPKTHDIDFAYIEKYDSGHSSPGETMCKPSGRNGLIRIFYADFYTDQDQKCSMKNARSTFQIIHIAIFPSIRYDSRLDNECRWYFHENFDFHSQKMSDKRIFDLRNSLRQYHFEHLEWIDNPQFGNATEQGYSNISHGFQASAKDIWKLNNALFFHSKAIVERAQHAVNQLQQKDKPFEDFGKFMEEYHENYGGLLSYHDLYESNEHDNFCKFIKLSQVDYTRKYPYYKRFYESINDEWMEVEQLLPTSSSPSRLSKQLENLWVLLKLMHGDAFFGKKLIDEFKLFLKCFIIDKNDRIELYFLNRFELFQEFGIYSSRIQQVLSHSDDEKIVSMMKDRKGEIVYWLKMFRSVCLQSFSMCSHYIGGGKYVNGRWICAREKLLNHSKREEIGTIISGREKTATYFLKEIVASALRANCGAEICSLVDCKGSNLLEVLEVSPSVSSDFGKELHPSINAIYIKLMFDAAKFSNQRKARLLMSLLIEKGVDVTITDSHNLSLIDYATQRHMVDMCSQLIIAGCCISPKSCEDLLNYLESLSFYYMKYHKSVFENPYARIREVVRSQILFYGSEHGTLSSTVMLYLREDALSQKIQQCKPDARNYESFLCQRDLHGRTPMHYASMHGHSDVIEALFLNGGEASLNMPDDIIAGLNTTLDCNKVRLSYHNTIASRHKNYSGYTPLALATQNGHVDAVRVLLGLGADPLFHIDSGDEKVHPYDVQNSACPYWMVLNVSLQTTEGMYARETNRMANVLDTKTYLRPVLQSLDDVDTKNVISEKETRNRSRTSIIGYSMTQGLDTLALTPSNTANIISTRKIDAYMRLWDAIRLRRRRSGMSPEREKAVYKKQVSKVNSTEVANNHKSIERHLISNPSFKKKVTDKFRKQLTKEIDDNMVMLYLQTNSLRSNLEMKFLLQGSAYDKIGGIGKKKRTRKSKNELLQDELQKREKIKKLFNRHPLVRQMRNSFGQRYCCVKGSYFGLLIAIIIFLGTNIIGANQNNTRFKSRIEREVDLSGFTDLDEKPASFYTWLQDRLLLTTIPKLTNDFVQIGSVQVRQRRLTPVIRKDVFNNASASYYFDDNTGTPWSYAPFGTSSYFENIVDSNGYHKLCINASEIKNDIQLLSNNSFIDTYTHTITVKMILHSINLRAFCIVTFGLKYWPGKYVDATVSYEILNLNLYYETIADYLVIVCEIAFLVIFWVQVAFLWDIYSSKCISGRNQIHEKHVRRYNEPSHIHSKLNGNCCYNKGDRKIFKLQVKYCKFVAKHIHLVRLLVLGTSVACVVSMVFYWQYSFEFLRMYELHRSKKTTTIYYSQLESALHASYLFRGFYTLLVCNAMFRMINIFTAMPQTGQFILAIKNVLVSSMVMYFLMFVIAVGAVFSIMFNSFFGDVVRGLDSLGQAFVNLMLYGMTQNQDDLVMAATVESSIGDPAAYIIICLFILFFSIILLNIFLAIVTQLWQDFMDKDLWDDYLDTLLRDHVIERHLIPESSRILTCSKKKHSRRGKCFFFAYT